ncbi:MAG TPA: hypothetical protein VIJ14_01240, partial [Rhabdochlamydiaceae bacterium]
MGAVMPATASTIVFSIKASPSSAWNNRTIVVIVCLASALVFIYRLLRAKKNISYLPDISKRLTAGLFPDCAMQKLPFKAPFAQGIVQTPPMNR